MGLTIQQRAVILQLAGRGFQAQLQELESIINAYQADLAVDAKASESQVQAVDSASIDLTPVDLE